MRHQMIRHPLFCFALLLGLLSAAANLPVLAGEVEVGATMVVPAEGPRIEGRATMPAETLELQRERGPALSFRCRQIDRIELREVRKVNLKGGQEKAAFYAVTPLGGGAAEVGFITLDRRVFFKLQTDVGLKNFELGPGTPIKRVTFLDNRRREAAGGSGGELSQGSKSHTVVLPANTRWLGTGIQLREGQAVHFQASGTIRWSAAADPTGKTCGPEGMPHAGRQERPLPDRNLGMLIARIRTEPGKAYGIGAENDFRTPATGELELGINDDEVSDNTGNIRVEIVVNP